MTRIKLEHIDNLRRGKKSWARIGSRAVPHHLYKYEEEKFERAMKYKYLEISDKERPNLKNIWTKVCKVRKWHYICLIKNEWDDMGILVYDDSVESWEKKLLKQKAKEYAKNYAL